MQKTATGRLRWLPEDFLRQDLDDTLAAINGYYEERIDDERIFRRLGVMSVSPYLEKGFDEHKYWPIAGDDELIKTTKKTQNSRLREKLRKFKLEEQQKKLHGGNAN